MGLEIKLSSKSMKNFEKALSQGRIEKLLKKNIGHATKKNALVLQKGVRKEIKRGVPPTNAALTAKLKGGKKPIVGTSGADLFNSITHSVKDWNEAIVGVLRMSGVTNVALVVHEGATIKVTQKMRNLFQILANVTNGITPESKLTGRALELWEMGNGKKTKWKPLKKSTIAIRIPSRPYMRYAVKDQKTQVTVVLKWEQAIKKTLKKISQYKR